MAKEICEANVLEISPMIPHQQDQLGTEPKSRDHVGMHGGDATPENVIPDAARKTKAPRAHSKPDDLNGEMAIETKVVGVWMPGRLIDQTMRLVEAKKDSEWYVALLLSDCKSLMELLKEDETLVRYIGHEGRTILHAAARRGCVPLLDQIMQLFKHDGHFFVEDIRKRVLLGDLFQAKDTKTKLRAVEVMEYFMGSRAIRDLMKEYYSQALTRLSSNVDGSKDGAEGNTKVNEGEIKGNEIGINIDPPQSSDATLGNDNHGGVKSSMNMTYFYDLFFKRGLYEVVNKVGIGQHLKDKMLRTRLFKSFSRGKLGQDDLEVNKTMQKEKESNTTSPSSPPPHADELGIICNAIVVNMLKTGKFEDLRDQYMKDKDYNFDEEHCEYMFHYACRVVHSKGFAETFIREFMQECSKQTDGDRVLQYLFKLHNWQGNTPCHVALDGSGRGLETLLNLLPKRNLTSSKFINARDARGWTPLHKVVAIMGANESWKYRRLFWLLLNDERIKVNKKLRKSDITPLHLAILHNLPTVVEMLIWNGKDININALLKRKIKYTSTMVRSTSYWWSPLQLAAVMGRPDIVKVLLTKIENIYEVSKRNNKGVAPPNYDNNIHALHMAAASGDPEVLRLFLDNSYKTFDPTTITLQKRTSLHCAVDAIAPSMVDRQNFETNKFINPFLFVLDFGDIYHLENTIKKFQKNMNVTNDKLVQPPIKCQSKTLIDDYAGKKTCITMLLQDGVNLWQRDEKNNFAEPGPEAAVEIRLWWFDLKAEKTLPVKKVLNEAANATAVVATLIATASYVGPLQPPLGYGSNVSYFDLVQTANTSVQIFVVSNCLAFYLAIGSIMFAIVPNVPTPHQGIFEEWQRSRRIVGISISLLLMSVINILISFAAASNAGMSNYYSWKHVGLAFYPAMLGGVSCIIGSVVFFLDFQRFIQSFGIGMKNDNVKYKKISKEGNRGK